MSQLDDLLTKINAATNDIAAAAQTDAQVIADLRAKLAAAPTVTAETLATLDGVATRLAATATQLQGLGADPANPVPVPAPVATPTPGA